MPPISPIPILGHVLFMAAGLKLPTDDGWDPTKESDVDGGAMYDKSLEEAQENIPSMPPQLPIPFFQAQEQNKQHTMSCKERGADFQKLHDDALDAVKYSHTMWKLTAKLKDLKVNALTALGTPGCLDGDELESNIKNAPMVASYQDNWKKYIEAVAAGVSKCYKDWQDKVMVPGLPWYPAFVAYPGPMAAPMPNIPMPLITCPSAMMAKIIAPSDMKSEMVDALDGGLKDEDPDKQHEALFESIATVLSLAFLMWLPAQQVMLVMGKGPVPSFAPPYVPVGPVVMGDNIAAPGHLMA